ncbi:MAG: hypothetical protein AAF713_10640 [Pseudomonadota bacterium]
MAVVLVAEDPVTAAAVSLLFLLATAAGVALWLRRHRIRVYAAIQIFLAATWIIATLSILVIGSRGQWASVRVGAVGGAGSVSATTALGAVGAVFAALMPLFHLRQRGARTSPPKSR